MTTIQVIARDLLTLLNQGHCLEPVLSSIRRHLWERGRLVPADTFLIGANGMVELPANHLLLQLTAIEMKWLALDMAVAYSAAPVDQAVPMFLTSEEYENLVPLLERENS